MLAAPKKRSLAFSHAFGSSGLSQEVRIAGSAKRTVPNEGYPFPACEMSVVRAAVRRLQYFLSRPADPSRPFGASHFFTHWVRSPAPLKERFKDTPRLRRLPVSYTHLTLPTIYSV